VSAILDEITAADDERRERNRCHRCHIRPHGKVPPVSHQICHRCHPNTLEEHPQKRGLVEEEESADQKLKLRLMGVVEGGR
jgi:hypothetical protein